MHNLSHFYSIDHSLTIANVLSMCWSITPFFKPAILANILLLWCSWQPSIGLIVWGKWGKMYIPLPVLLYWLQINLVCLCRSTSPFFKYVILTNIPLTWLPWQPFVLHWHCATSKYYIDLKKYWIGSLFILMLIIVVVTTSKPV